MTLTVDEALQSTPSLVFVPGGSGVPLAVPLTLIDAQTFSGSFDVASDTTSGPVTVQVSGRDFTNNLTNTTLATPALVFDTDGPAGAVATTPLGSGADH